MHIMYYHHHHHHHHHHGPLSTDYLESSCMSTFSHQIALADWVLTLHFRVGRRVVTVLRVEFIIGYAYCCVVVSSILLWNCSFFYMCNVNYIVLLLRISFYICMPWCVSCNWEIHNAAWMCVRKCYCRMYTTLQSNTTLLHKIYV